MTRQPFSFSPPRWIAGPHAQTILVSQGPRRWFVESRASPLLARSEPLVLECGDGNRLSAWYAAGVTGRTLAVVIHGWEGSADSSYVLSMAATLHTAGHPVVRLNLRDHGGSFALNPGVFHSCRLAEVIGAVRAVRERYAPSRLAVVGFSLGGNFALRVAADAPAGTVDRALAICPVLDPARTLAGLDAGASVYRRYFIRKWRRSLRAKAGAWPRLYADIDRHAGGATLTEMTERLVHAYTGFPSLRSYLDGYTLTGERLSSLTVPSSILAALDDPIIAADDLDRLPAGPALRLHVAHCGGHCGFMVSFRGPTAADAWVMGELSAGEP